MRWPHVAALLSWVFRVRELLDGNRIYHMGGDNVGAVDDQSARRRPRSELGLSREEMFQQACMWKSAMQRMPELQSAHIFAYYGHGTEREDALIRLSRHVLSRMPARDQAEYGGRLAVRLVQHYYRYPVDGKRVTLSAVAQELCLHRNTVQGKWSEARGWLDSNARAAEDRSSQYFEEQGVIG